MGTSALRDVPFVLVNIGLYTSVIGVTTTDVVIYADALLMSCNNAFMSLGLAVTDITSF